MGIFADGFQLAQERGDVRMKVLKTEQRGCPFLFRAILGMNCDSVDEK